MKIKEYYWEQFQESTEDFPDLQLNDENNNDETGEDDNENRT